jgi:hypothetical protein
MTLEDVDDEEESLQIRLRRLIAEYSIDLDDVDDEYNDDYDEEDEDSRLQVLALLRRMSRHMW